MTIKTEQDLVRSIYMVEWWGNSWVVKNSLFLQANDGKRKHNLPQEVFIFELVLSDRASITYAIYIGISFYCLAVGVMQMSSNSISHERPPDQSLTNATL